MSLLWKRAVQDDREWYHVSPYEFDAGQMVHAPKRSGIKPMWGPQISDHRKVYLHGDLEMANSWAAHSADEHGISHHVYQVRPHGIPVNHRDRTKDLEDEWTVPHAEVISHSGYVAHPHEGEPRYHPGLESGDWNDWSEDEDDKYCPDCDEYGHGPEKHDDYDPGVRRNPAMKARDVQAHKKRKHEHPSTNNHDSRDYPRGGSAYFPWADLGAPGEPADGSDPGSAPASGDSGSSGSSSP